MASIRQVRGFEILDSRGNPTVAAEVLPMMNIINGGAHADNHVDMQEFMILPLGAPRFAEGMRWGVEVFHSLKALLESRRLSAAVGDEGGFAPDLPSNEAAIEVILAAIEQAGFKPGGDIALGLDVASSEFHEGGPYALACEGKRFDSAQFVDHLVVTIEDGMAEGMAKYNRLLLIEAEPGASARFAGRAAIRSLR